MHVQAKCFTEFCKKYFPDHFKNQRVLDVGSGDINGNNRALFENCSYEGNDLIQAKNVTIVSKTATLPFGREFHTIISTECFEHDPEYAESLRKIVSMLKPGGLFCFTCASTGRAEHGTRRTNPQDSYGTLGNVEGWTDYYKNLTLADVQDALPLNELFDEWAAYYCPITRDLYFYGVSAGSLVPINSPPLYTEYQCVLVGGKRSST